MQIRAYEMDVCDRCDVLQHLASEGMWLMYDDCLERFSCECTPDQFWNTMLHTDAPYTMRELRALRREWRRRLALRNSATFLGLR